MNVHLYRKLILDLDSAAQATLEVLTELPTAPTAVRNTYTIAATSGREPVKILLPADLRGRYLKLRLSATGVVRLYGAKVYMRDLGQKQPSAWRWERLPVEVTPDLFSPVKLPIPPTPDEFGAVRLPIEPTPDDFSAVKLPIPPTPDDFAAVRVPIEPTPDEFRAVKLPIEDTPDEFRAVKLPIEDTPDQFSALKLPIRPTPDTWTWMDLPMDEATPRE